MTIDCCHNDIVILKDQCSIFANMTELCACHGGEGPAGAMARVQVNLLVLLKPSSLEKRTGTAPLPLPPGSRTSDQLPIF